MSQHGRVLLDGLSMGLPGDIPLYEFGLEFDVKVNCCQIFLKTGLIIHYCPFTDVSVFKIGYRIHLNTFL